MRETTPPLKGKKELWWVNPFSPPTIAPPTSMQSMSYLQVAVPPGRQSWSTDHTSSRTRRCADGDSAKRRRFAAATCGQAPSRR